MSDIRFLVHPPVRVGLVGTGYAAMRRADSLQMEPRAQLVAIAGHTLERTQTFSQPYGAIACGSWAELIARSDIDLVIIATINRDHGAISRAALQANKHVVVEYPLSLSVAEADELIELSKAQNRLLHVEHIELMGGVHQALKTALPLIGTVFSARYATLKPERPAPQRWTYHPDLFGFPLVGALSRLHRLTDLFGAVATVSCQAQFWEPTPNSVETRLIASLPHYTTCLCTAQLRFKTGVLAEVTYGKGEALWQAERKFEVQGEKGALILDGDQGTLVQADGSHAIAVGGRRGLFAKDTALVLDHLTTEAPLYVSPAASAYTLKVADAARRSAETGATIALEMPDNRLSKFGAFSGWTGGSSKRARS
ncbi:MAG: Gfo/Idh/MocA family oxidoreductase [Leptolyngbyaceae cyanobacterium RU_5_1]|nr:Gfo/Idh/MocA family oxidoreductase [Leptolyngbyaceae cyanobacterium RU_5_1]